MKNKAKMTAFGMVALFALSAANPVFAGDAKKTCTPCAVTTPSVSYHPILSGQFHEQIIPKDADGNILGLLNVYGTSAKVGVDWTSATNDMFTWGTHTTKNNSATVVELRY